MWRRWGVYRPQLSMFLICAMTGCGGNGDPPGGTPGSGSGSGGEPAPVASCLIPDAPSSPLRRLTRFEYANSVRDLLGVDPAVVKDLPADVTHGFDNNAALQVAPDYLVEKYVLVSEALSAQVLQERDVTDFTGCDAAAVGEEACARQFARDFGRRVFRRPLTAQDETMFMAAYTAGSVGGAHSDGIEVMIRMALQSPHFLYRLELAAPTESASALLPLSPFELATRLSFFLWGSTPDEALLDAAAAGDLATKEQVAAKAREMLGSPKAQVSLTNFLGQWSGVRKLETTTKNTTLFPNYSVELRDAMQRELPAFVGYLFDSGQVTLSNLFTANVAFVSGPLADIYDVPAPPGSERTPQMVELPESHGRAGLLTQAGFMSVQGHPDQTSPVLRGKFIRANLLCDPPPPPPDDVDISVPEVTEGTTARDRANLHLDAGGSCSGCHVLMDPIGLAFEHFDAVGQFREYEGGNTIDVSGEVLLANDPALEGPFSGVKELAHKLSASERVQQCVASQMFRFAAGRFEEDTDACSLASIQDAFTAADGDLVELMVAMTQTDAFLFRTRGAH